MREIKFRAWKGSSKTMIDLYMIEFFNDDSIMINEDNPDCTLLQYTGLKDKDGKEIYEGDIVETIVNHHGEETDMKFHSKIVYNDYIGGFQISYLNVQNRFVNDGIGGHFLKVIGNIYENPELLEGGEK